MNKPHRQWRELLGYEKVVWWDEGVTIKRTKSRKGVVYSGQNEKYDHAKTMSTGKII